VRTGAEPRPLDHIPGVVIAVIAGLHKAIMMGAAGNDDYQHLTYARQLLAGDLPLRDFWDISTTLQEAVSAVSQVVFGYRLLSEAIVVGIATAIAVFLVFRVIRTMTGSAWVAVVCASLFIVAIPRTYAYPKWLVYAISASLWWSYVWWPSARKAVIGGVSVAAAFYWRHDHGVLVAIGVALSMAAAHGWTREAMRRFRAGRTRRVGCRTNPRRSGFADLRHRPTRRAHPRATRRRAGRGEGGRRRARSGHGP